MYIKDTVHVVGTIQNELQNLKPAMNYKEAVELLDDITRINNELDTIPKKHTDEEIENYQKLVTAATITNSAAPILAEKTNRLSDGELRILLFRKLIGPEFFHLNQHIDLNKDLTWEEIDELIRNTINRCESQDSVLNKVMKVEDSNASSTSINFSTENSKSTKVMDDKIVKYYVSQEPFDKFIKPCWTCKLYGHSTSQCLVPYSRCCNKPWNSIHQEGFHRSNKCPNRQESNIQLSSPKLNNKRKVQFSEQKANMVSATKEEDMSWDQFLIDNAVQFNSTEN
jgi:hypothetical protein